MLDSSGFPEGSKTHIRIYGDDYEKLNIIAKELRRRQRIRKNILEEVGLPQLLAPLLQDPVEL